MLAVAPTRPRMTQPSPAFMFGVAIHSSAMHGNPIATQAAIHGLRRPPASAIAPTTGAPTPISSAAIELA